MGIRLAVAVPLMAALVSSAAAAPGPGLERALVVAAPSAATAARQLPVTSGQDGAPGSLRQIVEQVAKPGDSIVFPTALRVELNRKLTIPMTLAGLTIDGSSAAGGTAELVGTRGTFLEVYADGVTLRRLRLTGLPVVFQSRTVDSNEVGPARARIVDVETAGSTPGRPGIELSFATGFLVTGGRVANGIGLTGTRDGRIRDVTFAARGTALDDDHSKRLVVEKNTFESGRVVLRSQGAVVTDNDVRAGTTLDVWIHAGGSGRVSGNELSGGRIVAQAGGSLTVADNTVIGTWRSGPGPAGIAIGCATDGRRPTLVARGNDVRRMRVGLAVQCNRDVPITLQKNVVRENGVGIAVNAPAAAISGGSARENKGAGIQVRTGSRTTMRSVVFGGNGGLGIDRADTAPRPPTLRYDKGKRQIRGVACAGCIVDLYVAEAGKEPGEGTRLLGSIRTGAGGRFAYPRTCRSSEWVTAIATDGRRNATSEFAADVECEGDAAADLRVRATVTNAFLPSNGVGTFSGGLVVTNLGPAEHSGPVRLVVSSNRPESARAIEVVFRSCTPTPTGAICTLPSHHRGGELAYAWSMPVSGAGPITVRFEVESDLADPRPTDNAAEVSADLSPSP